MISDFLLSFGQLNLASLSSKKRKKIVEKCSFLETRAVEVFKYGKNNDEYWNWAKLHKQVVIKPLPIAKALYPKYLLLFLFDNTTSYSAYVKNALQVQEINKDVEHKQTQLYNAWFKRGEIWVEQSIKYNEVNGQCILKRIQKVLEKRNLKLSRKLNLKCLRPKCFNYQVTAKYKICIKKYKYKLCKILKQHNRIATCTKN